MSQLNNGVAEDISLAYPESLRSALFNWFIDDCIDPKAAPRFNRKHSSSGGGRESLLEHSVPWVMGQ